MPNPSSDPPPSPARRFARGLARASAGAVLFSMPILLTNEMWRLGAAIPDARLALLVALSLPLLVGASHVSGFEPTFALADDVRDAFVAVAVASVVSAVVLLVIGELGPGMSVHEVVGKLALQAVPASLGALLAQSQVGGERGGGGEGDAGDGSAAASPGAGAAAERPATYGSQLFLMLAGALFFTFSVAPTDEIVHVAHAVAPWHQLVVCLASIAVLHAAVYQLGLPGQEEAPAGAPAWRVFLRFSVAGYALVLVVGGYVLWTFGRFDGAGLPEVVAATVVLGLPGAVGAAAARLIL